MVAPKIPDLAFDATFLMALCGIAELRLKPPVGPEGDEAGGLLAPMAAQDLLHRAGEVVIAQPLEDASEIVKGECWASRKACWVARK
jgi:hypothetical protein